MWKTLRFAAWMLAIAVGSTLALHAAPPQAQSPADHGTAKYGTAIFAGGCFWCMEPPFEALDGVISVVSGYTGGRTRNPSYEQVSSGGTGHTEAIEITYDPAKVSYETLLKVFWRNVDAVDGGGQFCDRGSQYRSAIFYQTDAQKQAAQASKEQIATTLKEGIATELVQAGPFYRAEDHHQDYYKKNPVRYKFYKWNCGREQRLDRLWGAGSH